MSCFLIKEPKPELCVVVVYICVTNGSLIDSYVPRFCMSYAEHDPGYNHKLIIACNGGALAPHRAAHFNGINCHFHYRSNTPGWDIEAYQDVAAQFPCDFIICLGESVYFKHDNWLGRMMEARLQFGRGMYGFFATHAVRAHMNTTAFGCDADYLVKYPPVRDHGSRYEFEHGKASMWRRIHAGGGATIYVTRHAFYEPPRWREGGNGLNSGDQSELLLGCNHTDRYASSNPNTRMLWAAGANQPFQ